MCQTVDFTQDKLCFYKGLTAKASARRLYWNMFEVIVYCIKCEQLKQNRTKPSDTLLPAALQQASYLITKYRSIPVAAYLVILSLEDPGYGKHQSIMSSQEFAVSSRK